jgi:activator of HSP90 ATPase
VNIRKSKQYLLYDFDIEVDYSAKSKFSLDQNNLNEVKVDGSYKVRDINHDDLEDMMVGRYQVKSREHPR